MAQETANRMQRVMRYLQDISNHFGSRLRVYVNQYPPLAAFLFTLLIFSAIPVSLYVIFAAITIAVTLSTALVGFAIVEGFMLVLGGAFLLVTLGGITVVTGIGFSWLLTIWLAYRSGTMLFERFRSSASSLSGAVSGQIQNITQASSEKLQELQRAAQEQAQRAQASLQQ